MRTFLLFVAAASVLLGTPQAISACSCGAPPPPLEALEQADAVFMGTVIEIKRGAEPEFALPPYRAKFEVNQSWKGVDGETIVIAQDLNHPCEYLFELGENYLIYGHIGGLCYYNEGGSCLKEEEFLQTGICSRTRLLSEATEDIEALDGGTAVTPSLWGRIKALFMGT